MARAMYPAPPSDTGGQILAGAVTSADLYREMVGMRRDIAEMLVAVRVGEERYIHLDTAVTRNDTRITALERSWFKLAGGITVLSAVISIVVTLIAAKLR
jgi:hypothetical protein